MEWEKEGFYFHWCQKIEKLLFFIHSLIFFRKDDQEEIITISDESADEDSTPKESNDLNAAKRIKRQRNSSVRFSWHDIK